ncbi:MAG: ATP-dependent Clp protease proteolytic subunit [Lachnospiraceae bacterium]|nr:ATP-dependent Clp protease proteolytic subunit [Lachnospiraceae bacterium]
MDIQGKRIVEFGEQALSDSKEGHNILFLSVIGEIEGHELASERTKTTKYEHLLPILAHAQDDQKIDGVLILINTVGGDCSCGLALAEMIASIKKPVVSLIIGDSHSIGVPLSVASDYTVIAPTATMIIHPVRLNGTVIGAPQTFDYFKLIQDRIITFIENHSRADKTMLEKMMLHKGIIAKDLGTILVGKEAVEAGLADAVGGIAESLAWLHQKIDE